MYTRSVGFTALISAVILVLAGCIFTTGGQSLRAGGSTTPMAWTHPTPWTNSGSPASIAPTATPSPTRPALSPTPATPTVSIRPRPKVRNVTVSGVARRAGGIAVRHVLVGFRRTTCLTCAPVTVETGDNGGYAISVPMDSYVIACVAGPSVCTVAGSEELTDAVTIRSDTTVDVAVQPGGRTAAGHAPQGSTVYGRVVTADGLPVPYATISLLPDRLGQQVFANTAADGSYRIGADRGNYLVVCITPSADYACGRAGGSGDPDQVSVAGRPQLVEFVLCRVQDYPRCLSR